MLIDRNARRDMRRWVMARKRLKRESCTGQGEGGKDVRIYERRRRHGNGKERALGSFGTCMMRACGVPTFRLHGTETLGKIGLRV